MPFASLTITLEAGFSTVADLFYWPVQDALKEEFDNRHESLLPMIRSEHENNRQCASDAPCSVTLTTVSRPWADDFTFDLTASGISAQRSLGSSSMPNLRKDLVKECHTGGRLQVALRSERSSS